MYTVWYDDKWREIPVIPQKASGKAEFIEGSQAFNVSTSDDVLGEYSLVLSRLHKLFAKQNTS